MPTIPTQDDMQTLLYVAEWIINNKRHTMSKIRQLVGTQENHVILVRELDRVNAQVFRARSLQVEASLTLVDWLIILDSYQWKCAYCKKKPFQVMLHRVPLPMSGTTPTNCVPACRSCRTRRSLMGHTPISNV